MAEPRSAVMIVAEAWWEGPDGILQRGPVRIVNKSISGACVRIKSRIEVGARLRIQSRWDEFSGTARYCRSVGQEYLVGIQREAAEHTAPNRARRSCQIGKAASAGKAPSRNATGNPQKSQELWRGGQIARERQRW
jgi:hypothetical protein